VDKLERDSVDLRVKDIVRAEVCEETTKQMEAMEHACQVRIGDERNAMEQKLTSCRSSLVKLLPLNKRHHHHHPCAADQGQAPERPTLPAHVAAPTHVPAPSTEEHLPLQHPALHGKAVPPLSQTPRAIRLLTPCIRAHLHPRQAGAGGVTRCFSV
jgi:hypothetical protein